MSNYSFIHSFTNIPRDIFRPQHVVSQTYVKAREYNPLFTVKQVETTVKFKRGKKHHLHRYRSSIRIRVLNLLLKIDFRK